MTAGRHIVLESVAQEYLDRLAKRAENLPVGNPHTEQVALGPLINERQLANVDRIVTETVAAGASVRAGGTHEQLYYRPTVLADVTPSMAAFREEIFGPVAPPVRLAEQLGRVHPVAVGHRAAAGPRLPVLTRDS
jgi:benzaldehyde dehydrogenase (NAD)